MYRIAKTLVIAISLMIFVSLASVALSEELVVGVGNWEPYNSQEDESGIDIDLLKEAFKLLPQYTLTFKYMSVSRLLKDLEAEEIDVAALIVPNKDSNVHLSIPFLRYTNVAATLKKKNFVINNVSDLKGKSIAAFQGAQDVYGEEFKNVTEANPGYKEYAKPVQMAKVVARERKDVYAADLYIFLHTIKTEYKGSMTADDFTFNYIFDDVYFQAGFKDAKIRDEFNRAVEEIKANGAYEAVYEKYKQMLGLQ